MAPCEKVPVAVYPPVNVQLKALVLVNTDGTVVVVVVGASVVVVTGEANDDEDCEEDAVGVDVLQEAASTASDNETPTTPRTRIDLNLFDIIIPATPLAA
jgi:hypothetical protein